MIEFRLLGHFALFDGQTQVDLGPARQRCVLALLLAHHGQPLPTDTLIDRVWADRPPQRARGVLYVYMTRLRQVLAEVPARIERQPGGYLCRVERGAIDLHRFTDLSAIATRQADPAQRAATLREALALWHGEPLGGLNGAWVTRTRERLHQQWLSAQLACHEADFALGRHEPLLPQLSDLVARHPLVEPLVGQLMVALHRCGRHDEALALYRRTRLLVLREKGSEPGPALRELGEAIVSDDLRLRRGYAVTGLASRAPAGLPAPGGQR